MAAASRPPGGAARAMGAEAGHGRCVWKGCRRLAPPGAIRGDRIADVPARQHGFTLLEIVLVIALVAAISLFAMATVGGGLERRQLDATAKELASELRRVRTLAVASGIPQRFEIDPVRHAWRSAEDRSGTIPAVLEVRFTGARELEPAMGTGAIVFFGDGASTGGRLQLHYRGAGRRIDVAWLTGEVSLGHAEASR